MFSKTYKITTLTPVHVGNGDRLPLDYCTYYDNTDRWLYVLDPDKIAERLEGTRAYDRYVQNPKTIQEILERHDIAPPGISSVQLKGPPPDYDQKNPELLRQIKSGTGTPIIPGSSLKGAMRTAFLFDRAATDYFDEDAGKLKFKLKNRARSILFNLVDRGVSGKFAAQKLEDELLYGDVGNPGPNHDYFRAIAPGDIGFVDGDLEHRLVVIMTGRGASLDSLSTQYFKTPWDREDRAQDGLKQSVEVIKSGAKAHFELRLDEKLLGGQRIPEEMQSLFDAEGGADERYSRQLGFDGDICGSLRSDFLLFFCNFLALHHLTREVEFAERLGLDEVHEHLNWMRRQVIAVINDNDRSTSEAFMQLGWGIGWHGTTGGLLSLDENLMKRAIEKGTINTKYSDTLFPKSRRYVYSDEDRCPETPMGWVHIKQV